MRLKTYVFIGLIRGFDLFLKETTLHQTVLPLATSTSSGQEKWEIEGMERVRSITIPSQPPLFKGRPCGRITNPPEQKSLKSQNP